MGLSSYLESDSASAFVYIYSKLKTNSERGKALEQELKYTDFGYNTPGCINIMLAVEAGVVRREDFTFLLADLMVEQLEEIVSSDVNEDLQPDLERLCKGAKEIRDNIKTK